MKGQMIKTSVIDGKRTESRELKENQSETDKTDALSLSSHAVLETRVLD